MTRSVYLKLLVLVLLAVIVCLPEFFPSYQEFPCVRFHLCLGCNASQEGGLRRAGGEPCGVCVGNLTEGPSCTTVGNVTDLRDSEVGWFLCETKTDRQAIDHSTLLNATLVLQPWGLPLITPMDHGNHSLLFRMLFHCCQDSEPCTRASNQSCCILPTQRTNSTHMRATLLSTDPQKGFWSCSYRVLWMLLVLAVIVMTFITVTWQALKVRFRPENSAVLPVSEHHGFNLTMRHLNALNGELAGLAGTEGSAGTPLFYHEFPSLHHKTGLYTIHEGEEIERTP